MGAITRADETQLAGPMGMAPRSFDDVARMAKALAQARGFVPSSYIGNAPAIAAAIMTGLEIGIGPMQALREIHVIEGKPTLSANMMLALAIRAGVRHQWLRADEDEARIRLTRAGFDPHEEAFSISDAKRAGLAGRGNWAKHPRAMLKARAISAAMRAYCPDVLGGSVYVEGEIEHEEPQRYSAPDEHDEPEPPMTIEAQFVEAERPATQPAGAPVRLDETRDEAELRSWVAARWAAVHARYGADAGDRVLAHAERIGVDRDSVLLWLAQAVPAESEEAAQ